MKDEALYHLLYDLLAEAPAAAEPLALHAAGRRPMRAGLTPMDAAATAHSTAPNVWDLATADGSPLITLDTDVAERCYGRLEQAVRLTLHRVPVADAPNLFEPQLEVTPPPLQDVLAVRLTFADGVERELKVPRPRGQRESAWSRKSEPLPASAFGAESWPLSVEVRQKIWLGTLEPQLVVETNLRERALPERRPEDEAA